MSADIPALGIEGAIRMGVYRALREHTDLAYRSRDPIHAPDAESVILTGLLNGMITVADVSPPLEARHFRDPFRRDLFRAVVEIDRQGLELSRGLVEAVLRSDGHLDYQGAGATDELVMLWDRCVILSRPRLQQAAAKVVEMWRRRRVLDFLRRVTAELESGATAAATVAQLHGAEVPA